MPNGYICAMSKYRKQSHVVYKCDYHIVWVPKYRFQFVINNIQTLPSDYFNGKNVGVVSGMGGTAAIIVVLITTWIVPTLTKSSYLSFFILAALLVPLSIFALYVFRDKKMKTK